MRLRAVKAPRTLAEHTRQTLLGEGLIHPDARLRREGDHVLIPLAGEPDLSELEGLDPAELEMVEAEFEPRSPKPSLEDMLGFSPTFDVMGDIAVIDADQPEAGRIARALMDFRKSIKVVLGATGPVSGEFRTREFVVLAGEHRTHTIHTEYGCRYKLDLARVYFTGRLGTERKRVADSVRPGQTVVDLFAGVGPFCILIARSVPGARVVAVDKNPASVELLRENIRLNRVDNVSAVEADARDAALELEGWGDHVIMNLPHSSREFLDSGILAAKSGGLVHFYDITPEDDLYATSWGLIQEAGERQGRGVECVDKRVVRTYAPYQYNICIEFLVQ